MFHNTPTIILLYWYHTIVHCLSLTVVASFNEHTFLTDLNLYLNGESECSGAGSPPHQDTKDVIWKGRHSPFEYVHICFQCKTKKRLCSLRYRKCNTKELWFWLYCTDNTTHATQSKFAAGFFRKLNQWKYLLPLPPPSQTLLPPFKKTKTKQNKPKKTPPKHG